MDNYTKEETLKAFEYSAQVKIETLVKIMKIIDITINRGTFKASEITPVGVVYDSISKGVIQALNKAKRELSGINEPKLLTPLELVNHQLDPMPIIPTIPSISNIPNQQIVQPPVIQLNAQPTTPIDEVNKQYQQMKKMYDQEQQIQQQMQQQFQTQQVNIQGQVPNQTQSRVIQSNIPINQEFQQHQLQQQQIQRNNKSILPDEFDIE